jgi:hypothetical protein
MMDRRTLVAGVLGAVLALAVFSGNGCMTEQQARGIRDSVAIGVDTGDGLAASLAEEREAALARAQAAEAALDTARAEAELATAAKLQDTMDEVNEWLAPAKANLAAWDEALTDWDSASSGAGIVGQIGSSVLPFLPPGWQAPAVMVLGIGGALARAMNRSGALKSLAGSTVKLAETSPEARAAFEAGADLLNKLQNPAAKAAIDAAQGTKKSLPI